MMLSQKFLGWTPSWIIKTESYSPASNQANAISLVFIDGGGFSVQEIYLPGRIFLIGIQG
jgi:hypothetical protein